MDSSIKGCSWPWIGSGVALISIAAASGGFYYVYRNRQQEMTLQEMQNKISPGLTPNAEDTDENLIAKKIFANDKAYWNTLEWFDLMEKDHLKKNLQQKRNLKMKRRKIQSRIHNRKPYNSRRYKKRSKIQIMSSNEDLQSTIMSSSAKDVSQISDENISENKIQPIHVSEETIQDVIPIKDEKIPIKVNKDLQNGVRHNHRKIHSSGVFSSSTKGLRLKPPKKHSKIRKSSEINDKASNDEQKSKRLRRIKRKSEISKRKIQKLKSTEKIFNDKELKIVERKSDNKIQLLPSSGLNTVIKESSAETKIIPSILKLDLGKITKKGSSSKSEESERKKKRSSKCLKMFTENKNHSSVENIPLDEIEMKKMEKSIQTSPAGIPIEKEIKTENIVEESKINQSNNTEKKVIEEIIQTEIHFIKAKVTKKNSNTRSSNRKDNKKKEMIRRYKFEKENSKKEI